MALRDVVDNCGDGSRAANPVLRLIDSFTGEKAAFHEKWMAQRAHPELQHRPLQHRPDMNLNVDDFEAFEESLMAREMEMLALQYRGDPRVQGRPMRPMMHDMPMKGMPPDMAAFMEPMMRSGARPGPSEDVSAWEAAYAEASGPQPQNDAEMFAMFERAYGRPAAGPTAGTRSMAPPRALEGPQHQRRNWAEDFEQENKFAEFESIYRDKVAPLPSDLKEAVARAEAVPARDKWASEFEEEQRPGGVWQREFEESMGRSGINASSAPPLDGETSAPVSAATQEALDEFDRKFGGSWANEFEQAMKGAPLGEGAYDDPDDLAYGDVGAHEGFDFGQSPLEREYSFVAGENAFDGDSQAFERGQALFKAGRLTEAVEAFEAAVKQNPNHSQAWHLLGSTHAENDKDDLASLALLKAIQTDPDNRDALITLAVSYTNDFHKNRALECLQDWLSTAPEYQSIDTNVPLGPNFDHNHQMITNLFIQAARMRPADPDPDVQIALGLLYNLTFEYERAIDCFKAAAMKRPDDYLVWNKLGATQANAKQSEEAIDAFIRALEIKPSYTRACSNLGISFMSLNEYGEAAKAFLSALALNPNALHQWDNLRNVFSLMKRPDLLKKCDTQDISLFQDEFHF